MIKVTETKNILTVTDNDSNLIVSRPRVILTATAKQGLTGPPGPAGSGGDLNYTHTQVGASNSWSITHNLGKYPSVTVVDSGDTEVIGDVLYLSDNALEVHFTASFSGKAYLN